ncbi:truncated CD47-like protein [Hypsugopox virus]|nr:truncated CD47-like protein [Hypsugopox virus]
MDKLYLFCFILYKTTFTNKNISNTNIDECYTDTNTIIFICYPIINILLLSCNIISITKRLSHIKKVLHLYIGCLWVTFITLVGMFILLTNNNNTLIIIYGLCLIMFSSILIIVIQYNILYNVRFSHFITLIYCMQVLGYLLSFVFFICFIQFNYNKLYFTIALVGQCLISLQEFICLIIVIINPIKTIYEYTSIPF